MENTQPQQFVYQSRFNSIVNIPEALTFDDVLMLPQESSIQSRSECDVRTRFSRNIPLNIPIVSSPMDTVTEWELAKAMAINGGLGVIHRFMSIKDQAAQVAKVKRAQAWVISEPVLIGRKTTYKSIKELTQKHGFSTYLVTDQIKDDEIIQDLAPGISPRKKSSGQKPNMPKLEGILTRRDMSNFKFDDEVAEKFMTPREKMLVHVLPQDTSPNNEADGPVPEELLRQMYAARVEKIVLVTPQNEIQGLITKQDLEGMNLKRNSNKDSHGKLLVGAAIGANKEYIERAQALADAGVDVFVVDIANGHSSICIEAVKKLKELFPDTDIVAGSIATGEGAENLIKAGADGIRCGIGNGSICITRIVTGCGVPQFSALLDCAPVCKFYNVPLISDGGNKNSGNMCKALAAGADCVMLGRLVAGCQESPSQVIYRDGKIQKVYRGMAGYGANIAKAERTGEQNPDSQKFTPEGVEGYIPYAGPLEGVVGQFVAGIKSGMSYNGAKNITELQKRVKFIRMTQSGFKESNVHSISTF